MAVIADILYRVRLELGDLEKAFNWSDTGDGSTKVYDLRVKPVDPATLVVTVNNTPVTQPSGYTVQADHGIITFASAPGNNTTIRVIAPW